MTSLSNEFSGPPALPEHGAGAGRAAGSKGRRWLFNRYSLVLAAGIALLGGGTAALNSVVDPLWYWQGNQIDGRNFIFNERIAKLNLLLQEPDAYDCLIFGSSRVTLLDQTGVEGYRCANLAFSAGKAVEFLAYARYLAGRGLRPKLVIVGIDDFNFLDEPHQPVDIPDFVQNGEAPPGLLHSYLSLTALDFTQRTLRHDSPLPRYYDEHFVGHVLPDTPPFDPPETLETPQYEGDFLASRAALYRELREAFPEAAFWGFVPPISAWKVAETRYLGGILDGYLEAIPETAKIFDVLYDFSAPTAVTRRVDNTYDGSHYAPTVYKVIVERLQQASPEVPGDGFGLPVHAMTPQQYREAFLTRFDAFLAAEFPDLARTRLARSQAANR
ncbi:hypothetical protein [Pelagibius sp. 7325]|uniref:hypothetical protein n=1 Tax=Pelagibius sp. 7325 TaxID=3131994 RepID=UPI0030EF1F81